MKAIVVAGGNAAPEDAAQLADADLVIAADGGAAWLAEVGGRPDLLIGDMDSIRAELLERLQADGVAVERHPTDKDASDAELAVGAAASRHADEVVILGAFGGERLDHELANVLLLADRRWASGRLRAARGGTSLSALHGGAELPLQGAEGDLVTLLPLGSGAIGVSTRGLAFPLHGETLVPGSTRGLSNRVEQAPASVSLEAGTLLVIETKKEQDR